MPSDRTPIASPDEASADLQAFKIKDAASYDEVTEEFDRFTDRFTLPLAERMVDLAQLKPGERVLDIGTGTGIVALLAAQQLSPPGKVVGIDLSEAMLATANLKAVEAGLADRVEFHQMDAEALELEDGSFDVVVSLFALLHFPHPEAALKEMFRVLRPGGRLVLAVGSGPPLLSVSGLMHRAGRLSEIKLKRRGKLLTAPEFLNDMVEKHLPEAEAPVESSLASANLNRSGLVPPLIQSAGFEKVRSYWEGHKAYLESPEEFWDIQRTYSSISRKRLNEADPAAAEELRQRFLHKSRAVLARGGKLLYPYAAFYVTAQRPAD